MNALEFPVYERSGLQVCRGAGYRLWDDAGREYLDFYAGHAVAALGYGHPALLQVLAAQAEALWFQSNSVGLDVRDQACAALGQLAGAPFDRVFLVNSGAEANENALRIAFRETGRPKVVALRGAFHGRTLGANAVTDNDWGSFTGLNSRPFQVAFVEPTVAAIEAAIDDQTAAFIFEPVQGVAGAVSIPAESVCAARAACDRVGALVIADEIQSGMGRCGTPLAVHGLAVTPDLLTLGKGIAGGFPAAAVLAPARLADRLPIGALGTTFGGGPMACALIRSVCGVIADPDFLDRVRRLSARLIAESVTGPVIAVQGRGLLLGLRTTRPAREIVAELLARGVVVGTAKDPHIVRLLPPLVIDDDAVDRLTSCLAELAP